MIGKVNLYMPGNPSYTQECRHAKNEIFPRAEKTDIQFYYDTKEVADLAIQAAKLGNVSIILADAKQFSQIKLSLLKVLSVKILRSSKIIDQLGANIPADAKEYNLQTAIPEGAKVFPSDNGLNSPFYIKHEQGSVIMMPLESDEFNAAVSKGIFEVEEAKSKKDKLRSNLLSLANCGKTVAIAAPGMSKALVNVIKKIGGPADVFSVVNVDVDADTNSKEYIANMAKAAKEKANCDYGASISNISENETMSVCIADSQNAHVKVVHSLENEGANQLAFNTILTISEMLCDALTSGIHPPKRKAISNYSRPLIAVIACLVIAIVTCLGIGSALYKKSSIAKESVSVSTSNTAYDPDKDIDLSEFLGESDSELLPFIAEGIEGSSTEIIDTIQSSVITAISTTYKATNQSIPPAPTEYTTKPTTASQSKKSTTEISETTTKQTPTSSSTTKESTTKVDMTTAPKKTTDTVSGSGKFIFTVYGYGHGVGMSQKGAMTMANEGKTCNEILTHYYRNCSIAVEEATPMFVTRNGKEITLVEFLCKTVKKEIGASSPYEALKAQAIAAYTYAKANSDNFSNGQAYDDSFEYKDTQVEKAVFDVLNIKSENQQPNATYVKYNDGYANTLYFASSAGKTTSAQSVWGAARYPYLVGGIESPEEVSITTAEFTTEQMKAILTAYLGADAKFDEDPTKWIKILNHDGAVSESVGYIGLIDVCGKEIRGNDFRAKVMGNAKIRSHCFTIKYVK